MSETDATTIDNENLVKADGVKEKLASLGITLRPITDEEIDMVNSRDFDGSYPYLSLLSSKYKNTQDAQAIVIDNQIVGYGVAGTFVKDGRKLGEIGMTHVSPPLRDAGLGSILSLLLRQGLLRHKPDGFYSEIGDSTGKIQHLLQELGYEQRGVSSGAGRHPIWEKNLSDDTAREHFTELLDDALSKRLEKLRSKQTELKQKAELVDKDNPYKVDIEQTVNERLSHANVLSSKETVTFFGYVGSKIRLARSIQNQGIGYSIMLDVRDVDLDTAKKALEEKGLADTYRAEHMYSYKRKQNIGVRISSKFTWDGASLQNTVKQFSKLGTRLI